ncbi:MAG TPA: AMP-binding protein, partial [Usitatibacter sp.]|nr:AMP-binding protein [Usitatibacter sp.]
TATLPLGPIAADQVVACLFTSGSTGEPQPNLKTWGSLVADARAAARRLGAARGDTILGTVPAQHMYGFECTVMLPLQSGAALASERPYFPAEIDAAIARARPRRLLFITPFHLKAWLAAGEPARVETIVSATAPLSADLACEAEARTGARLIEIYGCTEAGQVATRRTALAEEWTLHEGMRLREQAGRVVVSGGHVEEPTVMHDVIEIRGDGRHFVLHGRLGDMVNIAGKRSSLAHLDRQLTSIEGVADGVFHAPEEREDDGVTRLMAFVVAPTLDRRTVLAALRERIDAAFLPRPLVMVESLPRDGAGKIARAALMVLAQRARR